MRIQLLCTVALFAGLSSAQQQKSNESEVLPQAGVNKNWVALLNDSMWFYEAQRSGRLPPNNRVSWRSDSALQDGSDHNVDLVGGYYDAGDYLKFTLPLAHSITFLSWGALEWFDGYTKASLQNSLSDTIRWGTDWLMKAHPEPNVLYVQVGDGSVDNNYWGPDTNIPTPRRSYRVDLSTPGTDVAAQAAAAFASSSLLFRNYYGDSEYADRLLGHAESVYNFAETAKWQPYTNAVPSSRSLYSTQNYQSQLVYGALWLYYATGNSTYQEKASKYFDDFNLATSPVVPMDWSDPTGGVYVLGAKVDSSNTKYSIKAQSYLNKMIHPSAKGKPCSFTPGGLLWCEGWSNSNSLVVAQNTALLSLIYSKLDSSNAQEFISFATNQIKYMLGNNSMLTPYVCGVHMNSPRNPHHAGASGGTDINNIANSPPEELHVLYGAVVGGPGKDDKYKDRRDLYDQTEVALDYNAPFQGLVVYQISSGAPNPPYAFIDDPRPEYTSHHVTPHWAVALAVILPVLFMGLCLYFCWRWRVSVFKRSQPAQEKNPYPPVYPPAHPPPPAHV